ncbi:hypothetical protein GWK47_042786 [Chionoecetes opilio]|uniref:Uncharacterized protein n=1 Tax=Chionoecetes opilio TaxID=41210 RepID=A0A8J5CZZ0_CHIOP|nr:hypothetical protein GWK47_042786 [Chionoecetes opilio]
MEGRRGGRATPSPAHSTDPAEEEPEDDLNDLRKEELVQLVINLRRDLTSTKSNLNNYRSVTEDLADKRRVLVEALSIVDTLLATHASEEKQQRAVACTARSDRIDDCGRNSKNNYIFEQYDRVQALILRPEAADSPPQNASTKGPPPEIRPGIPEKEFLAYIDRQPPPGEPQPFVQEESRQRRTRGHGWINFQDHLSAFRNHSGEQHYWGRVSLNAAMYSWLIVVPTSGIVPFVVEIFIKPRVSGGGKRSDTVITEPARNIWRVGCDTEFVDFSSEVTEGSINHSGCEPRFRNQTVLFFYPIRVTPADLCVPRILVDLRVGWIVREGTTAAHKDYPGLTSNIRHPAYLSWIQKRGGGLPLRPPSSRLPAACATNRHVAHTAARPAPRRHACLRPGLPHRHPPPKALPPVRELPHPPAATGCPSPPTPRDQQCLPHRCGSRCVLLPSAASSRLQRTGNRIRTQPHLCRAATPPKAATTLRHHAPRPAHASAAACITTARHAASPRTSTLLTTACATTAACTRPFTATQSYAPARHPSQSPTPPPPVACLSPRPAAARPCNARHASRRPPLPRCRHGLTPRATLGLPESLTLLPAASRCVLQPPLPQQGPCNARALHKPNTSYLGADALDTSPSTKTLESQAFIQILWTASQQPATLGPPILILQATAENGVAVVVVWLGVIVVWCQGVQVVWCQV